MSAPASVRFHFHQLSCLRGITNYSVQGKVIVLEKELEQQLFLVLNQAEKACCDFLQSTQVYSTSLCRQSWIEMKLETVMGTK